RSSSTGRMGRFSLLEIPENGLVPSGPDPDEVDGNAAGRLDILNVLPCLERKSVKFRTSREVFLPSFQVLVHRLRLPLAVNSAGEMLLRLPVDLVPRADGNPLEVREHVELCEGDGGHAVH